MRNKEIFVGGIIVLLGYTLAVVVDSKLFVVCLDVELALFYCLFLIRRMPVSFYKDQKFTLYEKSSIVVGIFFLMMCALYLCDRRYDKIIGRIGFVPFLISTALIFAYGVFKKLFTNMPTSEFKRYIWTYVRCILIMMSNIILISTLTYTSKSEYKNGLLVRKIVRDGNDVYTTNYNDSLSMFETKVHIADDYPRLDYIIYYDSYPDNINRIDTLNIDYY